MNIPSPYRLHLLGELARQLKERGIDFRCHFMARGHADRPASWLNPKIDFPHTYWRDFGFGQYHFNPGLILKMIFSPPEWMVCGSSFDTFTGLGVQLLGRAKVKMCWLEGNTKTPGQLGGIKGWIKRVVMGRCKYAPVPGSDAAKYVGLHQARTTRRMPRPVILPNLVDEKRFSSVFPKEDRDLFRREAFGADDGQRVCIIPARLEPVKGLIPFLDQVEARMLDGWKLVVMGQGPLKNEIVAKIAERHLGDFVKILDYVPYGEMPKYYASADLFLLPSLYDPNPLSVIEALHSGLPVAVSVQAGNVEEAVEENGWVLHVMARDSFKFELEQVFSSGQERLRAMGALSRARANLFWNTRGAVDRFIREVLPI